MITNKVDVPLTYVFGEDLGIVESATEKMGNAQKWIEHWSRYTDDLLRRQQLNPGR